MIITNGIDIYSDLLIVHEVFTVKDETPRSFSSYMLTVREGVEVEMRSLQMMLANDFEPNSQISTYFVRHNVLFHFHIFHRVSQPLRQVSAKARVVSF